jgi:hypothetical protein
MVKEKESGARSQKPGVIEEAVFRRKSGRG